MHAASDFACFPPLAPLLTLTVFRLIKLSLSALLNSIFPIPDHYFGVFLLVSIHPSSSSFPSLPLSLELSPLLNLIDPEGG